MIHHHLDKDVYIIFYTDLINTAEVIKGDGYQSPILDVCFGGSNMGPWSSRATYYFSPPFSHCKIAFIDSINTGFTAYSFTIKGFEKSTGNFLHKPGFSVLKIGVSIEQYILLEDMLERFSKMKDELSFSLWKGLLFPSKIRYYTWQRPLPYPSIEITRSWTCSEMVGFCLQQAGVFDSNLFHPSYLSPSHLFYFLLFNNWLKPLESYNPFYADQYAQAGISRNDTNAYLAAAKVMKHMDTKDVVFHGHRFVKNSLCKIFVEKRESYTQFHMMNLIKTKKLSKQVVDIYDREFADDELESLSESIKTPKHIPLSISKTDSFTVPPITYIHQVHYPLTQQKPLQLQHHHYYQNKQINKTRIPQISL